MSTYGIDRLVEQYYDSLLCFVCRHVRSRTEAEDIVQEIWARSLPALRSDAVENIRAYLYCVARHLIHDHYHKKSSALLGNTIDPATALFDQRIDPERAVIAHEQKCRLHRAIECLPVRQKTVFLLQANEGLSCAQIGRLLGISRQTAHEHITHAVRTVHGRMVEDNAAA
jgi:RNA polymerase sigma-70 factor (ECF subfamily)